MGKGRPSKSGKRGKGGRLKPEIGLRIVRGSDQAEERKAMYGTNGYDPLGRAFTFGLLGEGAEAKSRLDMGRQIAALRRRVYARGYRSALDDSPRGSAHIEREGEYKQERWLADSMARIDATGCGPFTDQLLDHMSLHADAGPYWLDNLIGDELANRERSRNKLPRKPSDERDWIVLRAALKGLDAIVPKPRGSVILYSTQAA